MSEIPLPPGGYEEPAAPPKKGPGCGTTMIVGLVIAIIVVAGVIIVLLPGLGNGGPTTTATHSERVVADYVSQDIDLSPTYYRGGFSVASSEVQTSIVPDMAFEISVHSTGSDGVSVSVHIAVYETSVSVVDAAASWGDLSSYLVNDGTYSEPVAVYLNLYNYASSYTWVVWFEASSKTDTWDVDITLTLRYNWV